MEQRGRCLVPRRQRGSWRAAFCGGDSAAAGVPTKSSGTCCAVRICAACPGLPSLTPLLTPPAPPSLLQVEMAPLCSADARPGRPSEAAAVLTQQLTSLLDAGGVVDGRQLCIDPGRVAWAVYVDVYVLDAGGGLGAGRVVGACCLGLAVGWLCCFGRAFGTRGGLKGRGLLACGRLPRARPASASLCLLLRRAHTTGSHLESFGCPSHGSTQHLQLAQSGLGSVPAHVRLRPAAASRAAGPVRNPRYTLHPTPNPSLPACCRPAWPPSTQGLPACSPSCSPSCTPPPDPHPPSRPCPALPCQTALCTTPACWQCWRRCLACSCTQSPWTMQAA